MKNIWIWKAMDMNIWTYPTSLLVSYFLKDVEGWRCKYT